MNKGTFVISLDFELMWGVKERTIEQYGENVLGARKAIPKILELFRENGVHCTWATVGLLFGDRYEDTISNMPEQRPNYTNPRLSTYSHIGSIGKNEEDDPYHYALSLIKLIKAYEHQEIGTHTFSHFYTEEDGQTKADFEQDLKAAIKTAEKNGLRITSLVLPRNQVNADYLDVLVENGITAYRGNEKGWMYASSRKSEDTLFKRLFRLADAYISVSGRNCFSLESTIVRERLLNIRASGFLRPYSGKLRAFEGIKIQRIKSQMKYAARRGQVFHLWWHPHNFGANTDKNLNNLVRILDCYSRLNKKYGFESRNMREISSEVLSLENSHAHGQGDFVEDRL